MTALIAKKVGVKPGKVFMKCKKQVRLSIHCPRLIQINVDTAKVVLDKFSNNETTVQLGEPVRNQDIFIIQTGILPLSASWWQQAISKDHHRLLLCVNESLIIRKGGLWMQDSLYRKYKWSPSPSPLVVEGGVNSNDAIVELLLLINACKLASAESITVSSINLWSNSKNILRGTPSKSQMHPIGEPIGNTRPHFSGGQVTLYFSYFLVVTPYFPYSKGDQKSSLRSPISSKLIANMLKRWSIFLLGRSHIKLLGSAQMFVLQF